MYDVLDICYYVILHSNKTGTGVSNLKLQKLLYFIQANFLIKYGDVCFNDRIEAWDFGPVVPVAYHEFKIYGSCTIPMRYSFIDPSECIKKSHKKLIEEVVELFSRYSATDLVTITHNQTPWIVAHKKGFNQEITPEAIKEYFDE